MVEDVAFGQISYSEELMTLTLTLHRVILHTVVHHSSTSTHMPNFIEVKEYLCGRTDVHKYVHGRTLEIGCIKSTLSKSRSNYAVFTHFVPFLSTFSITSPCRADVRSSILLSQSYVTNFMQIKQAPAVNSSLAAVIKA